MRGDEFADAWQRLGQPVLPDEELYRALDIVIEEFRSRRGLLAPCSAAAAACRALRSRSVCGRTRMPFSTEGDDITDAMVSHIILTTRPKELPNHALGTGNTRHYNFVRRRAPAHG